MYDNMGEFNSAEEINAKADELLNAGDIEGIKTLCKENGIDEEFVELFRHGEIPILVDAQMAAVGKLDMEMASATKDKELYQAVGEYMQSQCEVEEIAIAVRKQGKKLSDVINFMWEEAKKRKEGNHAYIPPFEVYQMAKAYYLK